MVNDILLNPMNITGVDAHPGSATGCTHETNATMAKAEPPRVGGVARRYLRKRWMLVAAKLRLDVFFNLMQLAACTQYSTFTPTVKGTLFTILATFMGAIISHSGKLIK